MKKYKDWIESNISDNGLGQCSEATKAMSEAFPELKRVRGHYICSIWGEREHWWLTTTSEGIIIDPTAQQFPSKGIEGLCEYVPWDESKKEPTGKCPNCGGYSYDGQTTCSESCFNEYKSYIESLV